MRICVNDEMDKPAVLHQKMQIKSPTIETYRWASKVYSRLDATSFLIVLASADFLYQRLGTDATFFCLSVTSLRINEQYVVWITFSGLCGQIDASDGE
ncbi:hypothetical protein G3492_20205 [Shewanella baltica]|nr:hypothetical protein [Shewanella baltica]UVW62447.1 hypothetical protein HHE93_02195 [Shewanella baltica]